MVESSVVKTYE
jgi:hypothetical protein